MNALNALEIVAGIIAGAILFLAILYGVLYLIVRPGRDAAERYENYRDRYVSGKR